MDDSRQVLLVNAIQDYLFRPFHCQLFKKDVENAGKSFLAAVIGIDPVPLLETDLLLFLGRTYNCWYEALTLLQKQYTILSGTDLSPVANFACDKILLRMHASLLPRTRRIRCLDDLGFEGLCGPRVGVCSFFRNIIIWSSRQGNGSPCAAAASVVLLSLC